MSECRGIRNRNPLNIRISPQHWLGKITPSQDPDFETFDSMAHGIRAAAVNLLTYYNRGLDTITKIVSAWAPSNENPTHAYINTVADRTGFDADAVLNLTQYDDLIAIIKGMADEECGKDVSEISEEDFDTGVKLALHLI